MKKFRRLSSFLFIFLTIGSELKADAVNLEDEHHNESALPQTQLRENKNIKFDVLELAVGAGASTLAFTINPPNGMTGIRYRNPNLIFIIPLTVSLASCVPMALVDGVYHWDVNRVWLGGFECMLPSLFLTISR